MIRRLFHLRHSGPSVNEGVEWEIQHHLEERVEELMGEGCSREDAERAAARSFGDLERVRRELRALDRRRAQRARFGALLETIWQDVRYGARSMTRDASFTLAVVLTLGLGIGANTALFGVVDALLLRPLPYANPAELNEVNIVSPDAPFGMPYLPWDVVREFRERASFVTSSFAHERNNVLFLGGSEPLTVPVQAVTSEFHTTLGVDPLFGRRLLPEDERPGAPAVMLIDHAFWTEHFGGERSVLGRTVAINDLPHEVVGVMPPGFKFPEYSTTAFWIALRSDGTMLGRTVSTAHLLTRVAGSAHAQATAAATALGTALFEHTSPGNAQTFGLVPMQQNRARSPEILRALWLLAGAVCFILLVAGANMINLLLVRATSRTRELAIRFALGASRMRVFRQMMTETLIISLLSGTVAVLLALLALRAMQGIIPDAITFFAPYAIALEQRTLIFAFALAALSGMLFGMVPAVRAVRTHVPAADAALTSYANRTRSHHRLRRLLVIGEVAMAVPLLTAAFLLLQSFARLLQVDPGFQADRLAVATFSVSSARYPTPAARGDYVRRLQERLSRIPGVTGVSYSLGLISFGIALQPEGGQPRAHGQPEILPQANVDTDHIDVVGARVVAGRAFVAADATPAVNHVIIDRDLAAYLWPAADAVGRRFRLDGDSPWLTVVGVISDYKMLGPDDRSGRFEILRPARPDQVGGQVDFILRTAGEPAALLSQIRTAIREVDVTQPVTELTTAADRHVAEVAMPRFLLVLMGVLGALGLALAALGIYGVLTFGVAQRAHEFAVRIALGARAREIYSMVLSEGLTLASIGAAIGMGGSVALVQLIRGALFGVAPWDPLTLLAVIATMLLVATAASLRPARRATGVDPLAVMRMS